MPVSSLTWLLLNICLLLGCVIEAPSIEAEVDPGTPCEDQACPRGFVCAQQAAQVGDIELLEGVRCVVDSGPTECNPRDHRSCDSGSVCMIDHEAPCVPSECTPDGSACTDDCRAVFRCQAIDTPEYEGCDSSDPSACERGSSCRFDAQITQSTCDDSGLDWEDGEMDGLLIACESIFTCQPDAISEGHICDPDGGTACEEGSDCMVDEAQTDCPNILPCGPDEDCASPDVICASTFTCQRQQKAEPVICHPSEPYACAPGSACQIDEVLSDCEPSRCDGNERCGPAICTDVYTCQPLNTRPVEPSPEPTPQPEPENGDCDEMRCARGYICELRGVDDCVDDDFCPPSELSALKPVCVGLMGTSCNPDEVIDRCADGLGCMELLVESSHFECDAHDDCDQVTNTQYECLRY
jgi:hypothetical protein